MTLNKPVSAIMSTDPVVANQSNKFSQIIRLFSEFPVHHLPVVNDGGKLIGIVSSNDIYKVFIKLSNGKNTASMGMDAIDAAVSISDIMTPNPVTVASTDTIARASKILAEKMFLSLPVVDNGQLLGILSAKDIIAYVAENS